jgi:hypothetical protein
MGFFGNAAAPVSNALSSTVGAVGDATNYEGTGMSKDAFEKMYGTPDQRAAAGSASGAAAYTAGQNQSNNPAVNPNLPVTMSVPQQAAPTYGSESGPGLLEQWFGERAGGTDPGYEYAAGRGMKSLDNAFAARGGFNSGASVQADSDYLANMGSQREGQLDSLAGGASGERANSLSTMLGFGNGITSGMAGLTGGYDLGAANALNTGNAAALQLGTNAALAPYQGQQGLMNNLFSLGAMAMLK